jgi:hypothetical protein
MRDGGIGDDVMVAWMVLLLLLLRKEANPSLLSLHCWGRFITAQHNRQQKESLLEGWLSLSFILLLYFFLFHFLNSLRISHASEFPSFLLLSIWQIPD